MYLVTVQTWDGKHREGKLVWGLVSSAARLPCQPQPTYSSVTQWALPLSCPVGKCSVSVARGCGLRNVGEMLYSEDLGCGCKADSGKRSRTSVCVKDEERAPSFIMLLENKDYVSEMMMLTLTCTTCSYM